VLFSHGTYWKELRRFVLRNLRDFGFGKSSMETLFLDEIAKLNKKLGENAGEPVDLNCIMNLSIVNALW
jgi:methyl farnesoate epoxidase/farnesoate epoxidase